MSRTDAEVELQWRTLLLKLEEEEPFYHAWDRLADLVAGADEAFKRAILTWWDHQHMPMSFVGGPTIPPEPPLYLESWAKAALEVLVYAERDRQREVRVRSQIEKERAAEPGLEQPQVELAGRLEGLARGPTVFASGKMRRALRSCRTSGRQRIATGVRAGPPFLRSRSNAMKGAPLVRKWVLVGTSTRRPTRDVIRRLGPIAAAPRCPRPR